MGLEISVLTWWRGQLVGEDDQGNKYYQDKARRRDGKIHRWVVYKGMPEASKVPADWHGWLHYTVDTPPQNREKYFWEKPHQRNLSGTPFAYKPPKILKGLGKGYVPWTPSDK